MSTILVVLLWVFAALNVIGIPLTITSIGKPQKPRSAASASVVVISSMFWAAMAACAAMVIAR